MEFAGGRMILKEKKDPKLFQEFSSDQVVVLQAESKDEKNASKEERGWMSDVYAKLKRLEIYLTAHRGHRYNAGNNNIHCICYSKRCFQ